MATYQAQLHDEPSAEHAELEHTIAVHGGWFHEYADIVLPDPTGTSPGVASVTVIDATHVRVTFEFPAVDNAALRTPGNYLITPSLAVYSVTPEATTYPTYVDLEIDEQRTGESYTLELQRIVRRTS